MPSNQDARWRDDYKGMMGDPTLRILVHEAILTSLEENGVDITKVNHNDIRRNTYRFHDTEKQAFDAGRAQGREEAIKIIKSEIIPDESIFVETDESKVVRTYANHRFQQAINQLTPPKEQEAE